MSDEHTRDDADDVSHADDAEAPERADQEADDSAGDESEEPEDEVLLSRRWVIRILVGLGLGIPIAIEARTLVGIVTSWLFGDGEEPTTTTQQTTAEPTTSIGEELLPETEPADTLEDAWVQLRDDSWRFEMVVSVENTSDAPYTLELGAVTTDAGTLVGGTASADRVEPGASETVTSAWSLPSGEDPDLVAVTGITHTETGDERVEREVRLGNIPFRG